METASRAGPRRRSRARDVGSLRRERGHGRAADRDLLNDARFHAQNVYALAARTELTARYRPELIDHTAGSGPTLLHAVLAEARLAPLSSLDLVTSALAQLGADQQTLALWLSLSWRPLP